MTSGSGYPDVYFTPGYGAAARDDEFEAWISFCRYDGRWQMPLIIRRAPGGALDAASPYGYSGIYASPELSPAQLSEAWDSVSAELRDLGLVSVFLRHSPLVDQAPAQESQLPLVIDHPTVAVGIQSADQVWSDLEGRCRTAIRKAVKAGYTARVRVAEPEDLVADSPFRALYEGTMQRRSAGDAYFFDDAYFERLRAALGENLHIAEVLSPDGRVGAASLLMSHDRFLHYHLSGSENDAARAGANNLMLWEACQFAVSRGIDVFHLGGGLHADDSLHRFKRSFGRIRATYRTTGVVLDAARYAEMSETTNPSNGFFPAYRSVGR